MAYKLKFTTISSYSIVFFHILFCHCNQKYCTNTKLILLLIYFLTFHIWLILNSKLFLIPSPDLGMCQLQVENPGHRHCVCAHVSPHLFPTSGTRFFELADNGFLNTVPADLHYPNQHPSVNQWHIVEGSLHSAQSAAGRALLLRPI